MIKRFIEKKKATLLCSGPMSKNCIDASIELSKEYAIPQILIASRRQVDSSRFGGGYVENFTTEQFSQYVRCHGAKNVFLARDHGGPWQSEMERKNNLNLRDSMESSKRSFEDDIMSGFDFLHLDPSIPIRGEDLSVEKILDRLFELYGHLDEFAKSKNKKVSFELGTEEQNGYGQNLEALEFFLNQIQKFCEKYNVVRPTFIVVQTGTKVMETQNVGIFKNNLMDDGSILYDQIKKTLNLCNKYDILLKEHNTDYLRDEALALRPLLGIHASNVAPEFGVAETKALLYLLIAFGLKREFNSFVEEALKSKKWEKWMLKESSATDIDKAVICGHYIFSYPKVNQIKDKLRNELFNKGLNLDSYLKSLVKQSMLRYIKLFKMI